MPDFSLLENSAQLRTNWLFLHLFYSFYLKLEETFIVTNGNMKFKMHKMNTELFLVTLKNMFKLFKHNSRLWELEGLL